MYHYRKGYCTISAEDLHDLLKEAISERRRALREGEEIREIKIFKDGKPLYVLPGENDIQGTLEDEASLSVRGYNLMRRNGCSMNRELVRVVRLHNAGHITLLKWRNLGTKTLFEYESEARRLVCQMFNI